MDSRQLRYFARVVELGSFMRASEDLNIAQSALSHHVAKLEDELRVRLLDRHSRGVTPTEAGNALLKRAKSILLEFDGIRADVRSLEQYPSGEVSIAALPSVAQILGPILLQRFRLEMPQIRLVIREALPAQIHDWLVNGRSDFAIQYTVESSGAIEGIPFLRDKIHVIGSKKLPALPAEGVPLKQIETLPLVLTSSWHHIRRDLERAFHEHDLRVKVLAEVDSVAIVKELVGQGYAYAMLPRWAVFNELRRRQLNAVPLHGINEWTELMLMWVRSRALSPGARELRRVVLEEVSKLVDQGWGERVPIASVASAGPRTPAGGG
jgi:LysR family transcriptional regulator, nitrogen assimilation regulatory protein